MAKLTHPNIVMVFEFGEAGGSNYLMMEYVEGVNLRQAMRLGEITAAQALARQAVLRKICSGKMPDLRSTLRWFLTTS